jgi:hypothetical protein
VEELLMGDPMRICCALCGAAVLVQVIEQPRHTRRGQVLPGLLGMVEHRRDDDITKVCTPGVLNSMHDDDQADPPHPAAVSPPARVRDARADVVAQSTPPPEPAPTQCKKDHPIDVTAFDRNGVAYCKTCAYEWEGATRARREQLAWLEGW